MRRLLQLGVALCVVLIVAASASTAEKEAKKGKKGHAPHGTVKAIENDVLTVEVIEGKKGATTTSEKKFTLSADTKFKRVVKVKGTKGEKATKETKEASRSDLQVGEKVALTVAGAKVEKVTIHGKAK